MAIKTIPEAFECSCDRCSASVKNKNDFAAEGKIQFSGRDYSGVFVGGQSREIQLCDGCSFHLQQFLTGKDTDE